MNKNNLSGTEKISPPEQKEALYMLHDFCLDTVATEDKSASVQRPLTKAPEKSQIAMNKCFVATSIASPWMARSATINLGIALQMAVMDSRRYCVLREYQVFPAFPLVF